MKTTSTFSILLWADLARAKGNQAAIYARITVNGKRATLGLKFVGVRFIGLFQNKRREFSPLYILLNEIVTF